MKSTALSGKERQRGSCKAQSVLLLCTITHSRLEYSLHAHHYATKLLQSPSSVTSFNCTTHRAIVKENVPALSHRHLVAQRAHLAHSVHRKAHSRLSRVCERQSRVDRPPQPRLLVRSERTLGRDRSGSVNAEQSIDNEITKTGRAKG